MPSSLLAVRTAIIGIEYAVTVVVAPAVAGVALVGCTSAGTVLIALAAAVALRTQVVATVLVWAAPRVALNVSSIFAVITTNIVSGEG